MEEKLDEIKLINDIIIKFFREEFSKASLIIDNLKQIIEETKEKYGLDAITLSDALSSIVKKGFLNHLRSLKGFQNALLNYSNGKIIEEELYKTAKYSILRSLITNTRNAYQCWVLLSLLNLIDCKLMDTKYRYLNELPKKSRDIPLHPKHGIKKYIQLL